MLDDDHGLAPYLIERGATVLGIDLLQQAGDLERRQHFGQATRLRARTDEPPQRARLANTARLSVANAATASVINF